MKIDSEAKQYKNHIKQSVKFDQMCWPVTLDLNLGCKVQNHTDLGTYSPLPGITCMCMCEPVSVYKHLCLCQENKWNVVPS